MFTATGCVCASAADMGNMDMTAWRHEVLAEMRPRTTLAPKRIANDADTEFNTLTPKCSSATICASAR